ncbi:MAG: hypothetical protein ACLR3O_04865 [Streptococcus sp.]
MRLPSLDPNGINSLLILIERIAKNHGLTFIISSHILSNLEQVCTKNYLLKNHKLICLDDDANAKYKIYTEDLSMKSLMTLLKLNDLAFERQKNDILVKGLAADQASYGIKVEFFSHMKKWDLVGTFLWRLD